MKSVSKRLLSLLLVLSICMAFAVPAFAAEEDPVPELNNGDNMAFGEMSGSDGGILGDTPEAWVNMSMSSATMKSIMNNQKLYPQRTGWKELDAAIANLLSTTGGATTYDKLYNVYVYLAKYITYSWDGYSKTTAPAYEYFTYDYVKNMTYETGLKKSIPNDMANRAYHVITKKRGVCYDYAIAFAVIARYIGINSYVHTGYFVFEDASNGMGHHGWTLLELGGTKYLFDPQRDARNWQYYGRMGYYFGVTENDALKGVGNSARYVPSYRTVDATNNAARDSSLLSVTADRSNSHTVTVAVQGTGTGTVTGGGTYTSGATATLTAAATDGSTFVGWYDRTDRLLSTNTTYSFRVSASTTVYARFESPYVVNVNVTGKGTVTGDGHYPLNTAALLTAEPESGYGVVGWYDESGKLLSNTATCTVMVEGSMTVNVVFGPLVTVTASRSGSVSGSGAYAAGSAAALSATPNDPNVKFQGWYLTNGTLLSTGSSYSFPVSAPVSLIAMFEGDYFYDVPSGSWYEAYATESGARGLVSGTAPFRFSASVTMSRAMVVAILARMDGADLSAAPECPFVDVPQTEYYAPALNWAYEKGIISGVDDTHFRPSTPVTREQFMSILIRYLEKCRGITIEPGSPAFTDAASISDYAVDAISKAITIEVQFGGDTVNLIAGYEDGTFRPRNKLSRAEGAAFLTRIAVYLDSHDDAGQEPVPEPDTEDPASETPAPQEPSAES